MMSSGVYHSSSTLKGFALWPQSLRLMVTAAASLKYIAGDVFVASFIKRCGVLLSAVAGVKTATGGAFAAASSNVTLALHFATFINLCAPSTAWRRA